MRHAEQGHSTVEVAMDVSSVKKPELSVQDRPCAGEMVDTLAGTGAKEHGTSPVHAVHGALSTATFGKEASEEYTPGADTLVRDTLPKGNRAAKTPVPVLLESRSGELSPSWKTSDIVETATTPATQLRAPDTQRVIDQVLRSFHVIKQGRESEVRIHLEPRELGDVWLRVSSRQGELSADFRVSTEVARSVIQERLGELRQGLMDAGMKVSHLSIGMGLSWHQNRGDQPRMPSFWRAVHREPPVEEPDVHDLVVVHRGRLDMMV
jgi:hypothetical protein